MYKYVWDNETGGVILLAVKDKNFKELRPVFYEELMLLKMDRYFKFSYNEFPYMWNDGIDYIYRGKVLFKLKKTLDIFDDDEIEYIDDGMIGKEILPIDIEKVILKNNRFLDIIENNSLKLIYDVYEKLKNKIDIVVVNYSGGKDSIVILDLVKRILMPKDFIVIYSDTGMEFNDTKNMIDYERNLCKKENIKFITAKAEEDVYNLWKIIGPPSKTNRWCCSIIKSTPSTILLKKITNKTDVWCLSFQGNRALEAPGRSKYPLVMYGQKYSNRISCNAILEWNSLEVFLYIFRRKLKLNKCYRNGLKRIGCNVCPMAPISGARAPYRAYKDEIEKWYDVIMYAFNIGDENIEKKKYLINSQKWCDRDGNIGTIYKGKYKEFIEDGYLHINYDNENNNWKEWIKTLGIIKKEKDLYIVNFRNCEYKFTYNNINNIIHIKFLDKLNDENAEFVNLFKIIFRKSYFCVYCRTCESSCNNGAMIMNDGKIKINENCIHCCNCHKNEHICFSYLSKYNPNEVLK